MQKLDGKFHGIVVRDLTGEIVPPDQYVIFLAKDNAFPNTLVFYHNECERHGAGLEQLSAVRRLIERVRMWRLENSELCKVPDAVAGECQ